MGKRWTNEDTQALRTLYLNGHSFEEIGTVLGRTANACQNRASLYGFSKEKAEAKRRHKAQADLFPSTPFYEERRIPTNPPAPKRPWWQRLFGLEDHGEQ